MTVYFAVLATVITAVFAAEVWLRHRRAKWTTIAAHDAASAAVGQLTVDVEELCEVADALHADWAELWGAASAYRDSAGSRAPKKGAETDLFRLVDTKRAES